MTYSGKRFINSDVVSYSRASGLFNGRSDNASVTNLSGCSFRDDMVERYDLLSANSSWKLFKGSVFDGRYMYLIPADAQSGTSVVTVRYDTTLPFNDTASYTSFDLGANITGAYSFNMGIFDGRYVYYTPYFSGSLESGLVVRYDTVKSFTSSASWTVFDIKSNSSATGNATYSFHGAQFDGRYIYFIPTHGAVNGTAAYTGVMWRYDTTKAFVTSAAWSSIDLQTISTSFNTCQCTGNAFDGKYIYFGVNSNTIANSFIIRYDVTKTFSSTTSYEYIDMKGIGVVTYTAKITFSSFAFDGTHLYAYNYEAGGAEGLTILQYEVSRSFTSSASWKKMDMDAQNASYAGYTGCMFDGRFLNFIPTAYTLLLRYDTTKIFTNTANWTSFDITTSNATYRGFYDGCFDGKYVYLAPWYNGTASGTFCRIRTKV